jgi:type IV pilus assembly protein PilO
MSELSWNDLDISELPFWPTPLRIAALVIMAASVLWLGHSFIIADAMNSYQREQTLETSLRNDYRSKYQSVADLPRQRYQLSQLSADLEALLVRLPSDNETPTLIEQSTAIGRQSGLTFDRIEWVTPQPREFYTALPMRMKLAGNYHQIGSFLSKLSGLDQIISVTDFNLKRSHHNGHLSLSISAETYHRQTLRAQP